MYKCGKACSINVRMLKTCTTHIYEWNNFGID